VFFTDVRIPAANLVGEENLGWGLAKVTLGNERVSLSGGGALWGNGPTAGDIWDYGFLFSPALTIGGGTWAVQRNIIAERVLGLPHDVAV
jgi:alkylation response protein AidB-like acyl-CoA dehydrogenase